MVAAEGPPGNGQTGTEHRPCAATAYDERNLVVGVRTAATRTSGSACAWNDGGKIERSWEYDAAGRVLKAIDPEGRYEEYTYDALGRKLSAESAVTLAGVSGPGCHGISGAVCSKAEWVYDEVGNVVTEKLPTGGGSSQVLVTRSYTYDKVQRLKTRTDELNRTWSFTYTPTETV